MALEPLLSIVIPVFNEERRLARTLERILAFLETQTYAAEVLVVDNGSEDSTLDLARGFASQYPSITVFQLPERGKGLAVRHGMLKAVGAYRFLCDADLSMPIEFVDRFLPPELPDFDIAIGSREVPGAVRYDEPASRHWVGRVFNALVRVALLPGIQDTQCGFKCFRAEVAEEIFRLQRLNGLSFDSEVLYIARLRGWRIAEIPIPWYFDPDSRVRVIQDSLRMGLDLLSVRRNRRKGLYSGPAQ